MIILFWVTVISIAILLAGIVFIIWRFFYQIDHYPEGKE